MLVDPKNVRRCYRCRKRLGYGAPYECPKCGYFDRRLWVHDHPTPHLAQRMTSAQIVAEYREGGWDPPAELLAMTEAAA